MEIIPINLPVSMSTIEKDKRLIDIDNIINSKRNMLLQKQKKIKHIMKQNKFLDSVKGDYIKYYEYIIEQKQEQVKALELLNRYIYDLSSTGDLSKNNIQDAKIEQHKILKEIKSIKRGLDNIIENTNYVNSKIDKNNNSM